MGLDFKMSLLPWDSHSIWRFPYTKIMFSFVLSSFFYICLIIPRGWQARHRPGAGPVHLCMSPSPGSAPETEEALSKGSAGDLSLEQMGELSSLYSLQEVKMLLICQMWCRREKGNYNVRWGLFTFLLRPEKGGESELYMVLGKIPNSRGSRRSM